MQKKKNLMRLKTRPYYALQGLVQTTGSAGGYDCLKTDILQRLNFVPNSEHSRGTVMARIMMKKAHNESISEAFEGFMLSAQSRGLTDKTLIVLTAAQTLLIMVR